MLLDVQDRAEEAAALEAIASGVRSILAGASVDDSLAEIVSAAAEAAGADVALARVASPDAGWLVTVAVEASAVLAAELEGSRLSSADVGAEEIEYAPVEHETTPRAIRRAGGLAAADVALVLPVAGPGGPVATLELYRETERFSARERALAGLAAAQIGVALELAGRVESASTEAERTRLSLELIGDALAAGSDEGELAEQIVRLAAESSGAGLVLLWRVEADLPPAFLAAHGFQGDPGTLDRAAERVDAALAKRGNEPGPARVDGSVIVPLGEPPAAALELVFAEGAPEPEAELLSGFAARAAVALRRARRAQLIDLALRRSQTIFAVVSQAIARLSLSHTLETAVERISELTSSGHVAIYLREGERLTAAAERGLEGSHTELAERLLELALGPFRSRGFLFIEDMRRDARLAGLEEVLTETGVRRGLVIPLVVGDEVIGALAVYKTRPHPYRPGEEGLLIALSSQLSVAVQNARLHERTKELGAVLERTLASERKSARQLRGLFEISHSFARSLSLEATLDAVAETMVELLGVDAAAIRMPDDRGTSLEPRAINVVDQALQAAATTILSRPQAVNDPLAQRVLAGEAVLLSDRNAADGDVALAPFLLKGSTAAVLPLATPTEVVGTLTLLSLDPNRPLDPDTVETATAVSAQAALAVDNARLYQQQKDFSETMQRSLLPSELPAVPGLDVGHVYESSARVDVGGDVYDFLSLEDGRLAVVLGDVSGKGIQAAADMAMAKFAFRALARSYPEPSDFLAKANEVVVEEIALGKFITMLYAAVDPGNLEIACGCAGHPPPRIVQPDGTVTGLEATGLALGVEPGQRYETERVQLVPNAAIVLYTDGVIEARRNGELYGEARLDAFLRENAGLSAQQLADALLADLRSFSGGDLADDCAVVCLRMAP